MGSERYRMDLGGWMYKHIDRYKHTHTHEHMYISTHSHTDTYIYTHTHTHTPKPALDELCSLDRWAARGTEWTWEGGCINT